MNEIIRAQREKLLIEYKGWVTIAIAPQYTQETMIACKKLTNVELHASIQRLSNIVTHIERMHPHEFPIGVVALN